MWPEYEERRETAWSVVYSRYSGCGRGGGSVLKFYPQSGEDWATSAGRGP